MSYSPDQLYVPQPPRKTNTFAMLGFVLSLVFAVLALCINIFGPISLALSIVGLVQIRKNPNQGGKGLAIAGIVISSLVIFWMIFVILFLAGSLATYNY